jgi:hypothetical protein
VAQTAKVSMRSAQQIRIKAYFFFDRSTWKIIVRIYNNCSTMDFFIFLTQGIYANANDKTKQDETNKHFLNIFYVQKVDKLIL